MKNHFIYLVIPAFTFLVSSCQDKYTETYSANVPQYKSLQEWRSEEIAAAPAQEVEATGKIYIYENYLFLVSQGEGVHIINNSNPSAPQNVAFLPVLGCIDVAVRNHLLYVDSYTDLLTFDIADPNNPTLSCRKEDVFDSGNWQLLKGYNPDLPVIGLDNTKGVITGWKQEKISSDVELHFNTDFERSTATLLNASVPSSGTGGSMAAFTIVNNYLYVLRPASITSFDLSAADCPQQGSVVSTNANAETIFPYNDHLFLGTTTGMLIYDLNNPNLPEYVSILTHLTACDPVVVQDTRAYVTIRTGTMCQGTFNQLLVVDISDYNAPFQVAEYNLSNPHGLGIDGNLLFICDGSDGLKVYNAEDDLTIADHLIAHYQNIQTFDVIPANDVLIMSADDGIYQYDYSNPANIIQLSVIPVN